MGAPLLRPLHGLVADRVTYQRTNVWVTPLPNVKARLWEKYAPSDLSGYGQMDGTVLPVAVSVSSR